MTKTHWLLVLILSLTACTEKIELPVPQAEPIPVLNSLIQPDSLITVYLSLSTPVLSDSDTETIQEATVKLFINGEYSETLIQISPGVFQTNQTAEIGKEYMLRAEIPAFETLKAITQIPAPTEITDGTFENNAVYAQSLKDMADKAIISFYDHRETRNYYQVAFYRSTFALDSVTGNPTDSIVDIDLHYYLYSEDPVIQNEGDIEFYNFPDNIKSLVFSDVLLSEHNTVTFITELAGDFINTEYRVLLRAITEDYYLFEKSRIRQRANLEILNYNPANFFLVNNPVDLYSNVENGLGIFAGYSETHYELEDITDYEF
jgi:hypothetical protein